MSTRARLGVQVATGEVKSVYVWRDGNPDTLGTTLSEYYATPEKAAALVERGNLIDVERTLRRCTFERPEEGYGNSPRLHKTFAAYLREREYDIRYKYIYRDGAWSYWEIDV